MKTRILMLTLLIGAFSAKAQVWEIGPFLGGSNFIGDVGSTNYIRPNSLAFGGVVKWNRSLRHSWRISAIYTDLKADDAKSNQGRRRERGYHFSNKMIEVSAGMEFNFWDWNPFAARHVITPYIFSGITGFLAHDMISSGNGKPQKLNSTGRKTGLALPMILGIKGKINQNLVLAFEIGARMAFYDNLDGSDPPGLAENETYKRFGNMNSKDWYMFTGFTLTYAFGHIDCYDTF